MNYIRVGALALVLVAGCTSMPSAPAPSATVALLDQADRLVADGDYVGAQRVYDEVLVRYPKHRSAVHARVMRDTLEVLLAARAELGQVRAQLEVQQRQQTTDLERLRHDLTAREAELARVKQELATRHADLQRLTAEAERLRADLEKLKNIDLHLERSRK